MYFFFKIRLCIFFNKIKFFSDGNSFSLTVRKTNYTLPLSSFKISKNRLPLMKKNSLLTPKNPLRYAFVFDLAER